MIAELWKMASKKDKSYDVVNGVLVNVHFRKPGVKCT